jgi:hypothetical protein
MPKSRMAAATAAATLATALIPAAALGAGDSLSISGKHKVHTGAKTTIAVSGRASKRLGLAIYLDKQACARKVVKEQARGSSSSLVVKSVNGRFRDTVTFEHSSAGSHYICAYLYHAAGGSFATNRHAGFHYVTR